MSLIRRSQASPGLLLSRKVVRSSEHLAHNGLHVFFCCAVIDDAPSQRKFIVDHGSRHVDAAASNCLVQNRLVQRIDVSAPSNKSKANCAQRNRGKPFQFGFSINESRQQLGKSKVMGMWGC